MKKAFLVLYIILFSITNLMAQDVEMADTMRSNGKIYVVVAVLCVVFAAITAYIISVDRRLSRLEKENKK